MSLSNSWVSMLQPENRAEPLVVCEPLVVKRSTAARLLDCSQTSVWKLCRSGILDTVKLGDDPRITMASLRRYVESQLPDLESGSAENS